MIDFKNKKVTVVGLGESGLAATHLLCQAGAQVRVTDSSEDTNLREKAKILAGQGVEVELGRHTDAFINQTELVVVSPGVPFNIRLLERARQRNIKIISEIELGYLFCPSPVIAITGTNGKSTVVTLLGHIFSQAGLKAQICGNISPAFCSVVTKVNPDTTLIVEVSSYQLALIDKFRPRVSVILNISPDHIEHHGSFEEYIQAKLRIFKNQQEDDFLIINDNLRNKLQGLSRIKPKILTYFAEHELHGDEATDAEINISGYGLLDGNRLFIVNGDLYEEVIKTDKIKLKGSYNLENILAAALAAWACGIELEHIAKSISEFRGLPHRLEHFFTRNGVSFVNDSKATNVEATLCALEAIEAPIILIAGGKDKNLDYSQVKPLISQKVKLIILLGEAKKAIRSALSDVVSVKEAMTLEEAVSLAYSYAQEGDTVLLSPMCSSFDMFDNFEHRGQVFKSIVRSMIT